MAFDLYLRRVQGSQFCSRLPLATDCHLFTPGSGSGHGLLQARPPHPHTSVSWRAALRSFPGFPLPSETQWKPMDKNSRVGGDCLVSSVLSVHTWPLITHYNFVGFLPAFMAVVTKGAAVGMSFFSFCHLLKFISPGWTLRM